MQNSLALKYMFGDKETFCASSIVLCGSITYQDVLCILNVSLSVLLKLLTHCAYSLYGSVGILLT